MSTVEVTKTQGWRTRGKVLRKKRLGRAESITEMARRHGLAPVIIDDIEQGLREPSILEGS